MNIIILKKSNSLYVLVEAPQQPIIPLSTSTTLGENIISPCHDGSVVVYNHNSEFKTPLLRENEFIIPKTGQEVYTIDTFTQGINQMLDRSLQELHSLVLNYGVLELILKNKWLTQLKSPPDSSPLSYPEQDILAQHQPSGPITRLPALAHDISEYNATNDSEALCPIGELINYINTNVAHGKICPPQWNIQNIQQLLPS